MGELMDHPPDQLAALSRLFSSGVIQELARKGKSPLFARLAGQSSLLERVAASSRVHDFFDAAFALLSRRGYRDEYVYKTVLTQRILLGTHSLRTASMLTEFRVGDSKADLAILNGTSTVYEVKSERDSLTRLEKQVAAYARVFSRVCVIAGENHIDTVFNLVPNNVGVLRLTDRNQISPLRGAVDCRDRTSPGAIFDSIRLVEAQSILRSVGISMPEVPNIELHSVVRNMFVKLPPAVAHDGMVRVLKRTRNLRRFSELVGELPASLHTAALSVPLRKIDHTRLVSAVKTPLTDAMAWA